jgi:CubicO group peptidase (beta-lactamase class C family)
MTGLTRMAVLDACQYLDSWFAFQQRHLRVPGVQVAILHDDEVLLDAAYGVADETTGEPLTTNHVFRIASHSKTFTATCVMQLVEQGRVRLDDTAGRWIDELAGEPIGAATVRELLAHASGMVRDGWDGDFWQLFREFPAADELVRIAADASSVLPRNERFKYSNIGYSLLGLVIERASGRSYASYVTEHVIDRLGLAHTTPELDPSRAHTYAGGHSSLEHTDVRRPIDHVDTHAMAAATGFASTARDVVRYAAAHFFGDDRLLSDDSKRLMQKTEWEVEGSGGGAYGLGFAINTVGGRRLLGHGGGYPGHITRTMFDPVDRLAVSVMTNAIDGPAQQLATAAVSVVNLAASGTAPEVPAGVDVSGFTGSFSTLWGTYDVVDLGGRLYQLPSAAPDPTAVYAELEVVDERTLRITKAGGYASRGEMLSYTFADDGTVVSVRGGSANTAYPLDRMRAKLAALSRVTLGGGLRD